jgi:hypothetical protein
MIGSGFRRTRRAPSAAAPSTSVARPARKVATGGCPPSSASTRSPAAATATCTAGLSRSPRRTRCAGVWSTLASVFRGDTRSRWGVRALATGSRRSLRAPRGGAGDSGEATASARETCGGTDAGEPTRLGVDRAWGRVVTAVSAALAEASLSARSGASTGASAGAAAVGAGLAGSGAGTTGAGSGAAAGTGAGAGCAATAAWPARRVSWARAAPRVPAEGWEHSATEATAADRRTSRRRRSEPRDGRTASRAQPPPSGRDPRSGRLRRRTRPSGPGASRGASARPCSRPSSRSSPSGRASAPGRRTTPRPLLAL